LKMRIRRLKSLIAFSLLVLLLLGGAIFLKNLILHQVKKKIEATLHYARLRLTVIPPAIVLEDVRTVSASPFFSAEQVIIQIPFLSLLKRDRPLRVFIERPVLRIYENPRPDQKQKVALKFPLPISIENGFIRDGEFYYWGEKTSFTSYRIKAFFRQAQDRLVLRAESDENSLLLDSLDYPLTGKASVSLEGKGNTIAINRIRAFGPEFIIKGQGVLSNPEQPEFEIQAALHGHTNLIQDMFDLPFNWMGTADGKGTLTLKKGEMAFRADLTSSDLVLNTIALGNVEGKVVIGGQAGGRVALVMQKRAAPKEFMDITFKEGKVEGKARDFHLDPIIEYVRLPWPVSSPVTGNFAVDKGRLHALAQFNDDFLAVTPGRFGFRGIVDFNWDGKKKISFTSQKLESSFAVMNVDGTIEIGKDIQVVIQGDVADVKQGREFTSLILKERLDFPEIRGQGTTEIKILGDFASPQIKAEFSLVPGGFAKFEAGSVSGLAEIAKGELSGLFKINDSSMKGDLRLLSRPKDLNVKIHIEEGLIEKILPALDLDIPLQGRASGDIEITEKGQNLLVQGDFAAPRVNLAGQDLRDVKGKLLWTDESKTLAFPEIAASLFGGKAKGYFLVGFKNKDFDIDLTAENVSLSSIYSPVKGQLAFGLKGKGLFSRDFVKGKFDLKDLQAASFERAGAAGDIELSYIDDRLNVKLDGRLEPGDNDFSLTFSYPQAEKSYSLNLKGRLSNFDLFLPWKGVKGEANFLAEIKGPKPSTQLSGVIDFKGPLFPFPDFAQALTDYTGLVFIQNNKVSVRSLQAKLGGGNVFGSGEIRIGKGGLEFVDLRAEGKDMVLSLLERTRALADGSLRLLRDENRFALSGEFLIKQLSWRRELDEKFSFSSSPYIEAKKEPSIFDDMTLDIRLRADDSAVVENALGRIQGRFDLTIAGNAGSPIVLGDIEGLRGDVYFQDRKFRVLRAKLSFFNPTTVEPYLDFRGETFLKDYRVTFSLTGLVDHLRPEFASSPPLPPEDVLALLALGESFKRTYSYDTSSQLSTGSLLSFQIAEEAKKRAEKLFSLDRFRIDPFVLGASTEMTARLTVGKKISRNIILLYSTNLTTQREEIVRLEWEFRDNFSLVGMRDERGRLSFDAKIRKRF